MSARPPLVLVAASGLAREALAAVRSADRYEVVGVLDDDPSLRGTSLCDVAVLGPLEAINGLGDIEVLLCAGKGTVRAELARRIVGLGVSSDSYATVLHPSVELPAGCRVGAGSILLTQVALTAGVTIGRHVVAMPHVTLTHDTVVEDFATLAAGVSLGGGVVVGRAAYLGMNASVRQGVCVGANAVLGMGAALLSNLPEAETWAGVPARELVASVGREPLASRDACE